jgi:hypothetical protein
MYSTVHIILIFLISIRINCNRISEGLLYLSCLLFFSNLDITFLPTDPSKILHTLDERSSLQLKDRVCDNVLHDQSWLSPLGTMLYECGAKTE